MWEERKGGRKGGRKREGEKEEGERDDEGGRKEERKGDRLASPQVMNVQVLASISFLIIMNMI